MSSASSSPGLGQRHFLALLCHLVLASVFCTRLAYHDTYESIYNISTASPLDGTAQALLLGGADCGSLLLPLPAGLMAQKYSGRHLVSTALLISALLNSVMPALVHANFYALMAVRVAMGIAHGAVLPSMAAVLGHWVPLPEVSLCLCLVFSGMAVGTTLSGQLALWLPGSQWGWEAVFYAASALTLLALCLWVVFACDAPVMNPWIEDKERRYLQLHIEHRLPNGVPWLPLLTDPAVWAIVLYAFFSAGTLAVIVHFLPLYLESAAPESVVDQRLLSAFPVLASVPVGAISAPLTDLLLGRKYLPATVVRKSLAAVSSAGMAVSLAMVPQMEGQQGPIIALLFSALASAGLLTCSLLPNVLEVAPEHAAIITALGAIAGGLGATAAPLVTFLILGDHFDRGWDAVTVVWAVAAAIGGLVFILLGSSDRRNWLAAAAAPTVPYRPDDRTALLASTSLGDERVRRYTLVEEPDWGGQWRPI